MQMNNLILSKQDMTLSVLSSEHEHDLTNLASDKKIWHYAPGQFHQPHVFKEMWFDKAIQHMAKQERICFVIQYQNKIIGSTSLYEIDLSNRRAHVGYTWFHPSVWGSKVNPLSKLIILEYAFETLMLNRIGFSVDSQNDRSCRALEKYGMQREGILRNHIVLPNRIRHSVIFSVINTEWNTVKQHLSNIIGII